MNRLEARLRQDHENNQRNGSERYSLRKLEPKVVDSEAARGSKAATWSY
jgi:hypothetical protein